MHIFLLALIAKLLIDFRADVNDITGDGWTALMNAVSRGNTKIIALLRAQRAR
jgi:ankyrin repeat protein